MPTLMPEELERWSQALLEGAGLEAHAAEITAVSLVAANRRGVDSHGVARLPIYAQRLRVGSMNGQPRPKVERQHGAVALVDADHGPGQVAGVLAADLSIDLARRHGVGAVAVHRSSHYGAAAYYAIRAASAGLVGISTTNAEPFAIPFGGLKHALGTNPISLAAPTATGIFDFDMASSQVAHNKVRNAAAEGHSIPEGWGVDERGHPTTDPHQVAAVVPLGGYKGYGLAVLVEILSGVLAGAGITHGVGRLNEELERPQDVGHFHLALDPEPLVGSARFAELLSGLLDELKAIPAGPIADEVLVPGEPEARIQAKRDRDGIPLPDAQWALFEGLSRELEVPVPDQVRSGS